ncbi:MAG: AmmeMemoRadiSam system protein B [Alphaproteobacteria bacterium]|nr:AmmeMemoRadiSam system protein B [Alphaproteobacteria bacterium]
MEFDKKKFSTWFMIITIILIIGGFNVGYFFKHISSNKESIVNYSLEDDDINPIREAAVAGVFYPADTYQLNSDINGYIEHISNENSGKPKILIVPHAGYKYSAQVAASAFKKIQPFKNKFKKIFLLGPSHRVRVNGVALAMEKSFRTPLGIVKTDLSIANQLDQTSTFYFNSNAHRKEHSLEVIIPFLQKTLDNFQIIPMVYGSVNPEDVARILQPHLEREDSLLIISADLSHYLDYTTAQQEDKKTAEKIKKGEPLLEHQSCGATGINTAMILAKDFALVPHLLDMANSGDTAGDKDRVVGYGAWAFEEDKQPETLDSIELEEKNLHNFTRHNKDAILKIVKTALYEAVMNNNTYSPKREDFDNVMFNKGATFVTLEKNNKLRGCIGSILPVNAVADDLAKNTILAALNDSRFKPVSKKELPKITYKISFLTSFVPIKFSSYDDLLTKIEPYIDGILIKDGKRQGIYLPSVWELISDKHEFMNQLKIKAGLSPSYWSDKIEVYKFRTVEVSQ